MNRKSQSALLQASFTQKGKEMNVAEFVSIRTAAGVIHTAPLTQATDRFRAKPNTDNGFHRKEAVI